MAQPELKGKVSLDGRGVSHTLGRIKGEMASFASGAKSLMGGIFTGAALVGWTKSVRDAVTRIKDLSEQFRITTDEVQQSDYALEQSGLKFENLGTALNRLFSARREAVEGNEELRATFEKYGITLKQLNDPQVRNYDLLLQMSQAMQGMSLSTREQADLSRLLGDRSVKLLTTLQSLSTIKPPSMFTQEDVERIDKADKLWKRMLTAGKVWTAERFRDAALFYGIGEDSLAQQERKTREESGKTLSRDEVARLNAEKHFQLYWKEQAAIEAAKEGMFEVDKDVKQKKERKRREGGGASSSIFPEVQGPSQSGAYSAAFINGLNPSMFIQRDQLSRLEAIEQQLKEINSKTVPPASASDNPYEV